MFNAKKAFRDSQVRKHAPKIDTETIAADQHVMSAYNLIVGMVQAAVIKTGQHPER